MLKGAIELVTAAVALYRVQVLIATGATVGLTAAQLASPWGLVAAGIALAVGGMVAYVAATKDGTEAVKNLNKSAFVRAYGSPTTETLPSYGREKSIRQIEREAKAFVSLDDILKDFFDNLGNNGSTVKSFFAQLAEDVRKESTRLKLSNLLL